MYSIIGGGGGVDGTLLRSRPFLERMLAQQVLAVALIALCCVAESTTSRRRPDNSTSSSSSSSYHHYKHERRDQQQQQQQQPQQQQQQLQQEVELNHQHHHHRDNETGKGEGGSGGGSGGGGGGGGGGSCEDIRAIQATVIRILNDHHDYDRGIDAFQSELHAVKTDVDRLRKHLQKYLASDDHRSPRFPQSQMGRLPAGTKSPLSPQRYEPDNQPHHQHRHHHGSSAAAAIPLFPNNSSLPLSLLSSRLDNLTLLVDLQSHQIRQLERRLKWLTKQQQQSAAASPSSSQSAQGRAGRSLPVTERGGEGEGERERDRLLMQRCEREMAIARDLTTKQKDINANVQRKMQQLEKIVADNIQADDHHNHLTSSNHPRMHHGTCPSGFIRHLSSCYLFENSTFSWIDAEKRCQAMNPSAHLVSIDTEDEEDFLLQYRSYNAVRWSSRYLWIGANDMTIEGRWTWVASGSEVIYSNWRSGEPSNFRGEQHCAYLHAPEAITGKPGTVWNSGGRDRGPEGRWDDWSCYSTRINFVCEIVL